MGDNGDIARYAYWLPRQDTSGIGGYYPFGSAHVNGLYLSLKARLEKSPLPLGEGRYFKTSSPKTLQSAVRRNITL